MTHSPAQQQRLVYIEEPSEVDLDYLEQICDIHRGQNYFCSIYRDPLCMDDYYVEAPIRRRSFLWRFNAALTLQQMMRELLVQNFAPQQLPSSLRNTLDSTFDALYEQHGQHFALHM
jgi:hypothetical protein